ncbi:hypothetical protein CW740_02480 [Kangiella profundi]|uniref:Uncharacterized protein n=1 Tax=Kangiella profundi TaxID=1561924 RepID=A0A2K9AP23_9GAMM|nr:hypothetical protein [Kangiella profundi]AUD78163.1 hypothetical protein CW740_02480 [Kangiella profundi]GGF05629.1 hypothetical protein GCM10011356_19010 [Kangiella profundi]
MKVLIQCSVISLVSLTLLACAGAPKKESAATCRAALDVAYKELNFAESEGFAGSVNYTKAASLLTAAKTNQTFESYDACVKNANKARYYIAESKKG